MQRILLSLTIWLIAASNYAQIQKQKIEIKTLVPKVKVVLFDSNKEMIVSGYTPFLVYLNTDSTYFFISRHKYCHLDSGYVHIDTTTEKLEIPTRPFMGRINLDVTPNDAEYSLINTKYEKESQTGKVQSSVNTIFGIYDLILRKKDYRKYRQQINIKSDTTITIATKLQYCPPKLIVAINAGLASHNSIPLGLSVSYGGVHGAYMRYMQTFVNNADGKDFDNHVFIDALSIPYQDCKSEYMSAVAGYQYLTPFNIYLQGGLGFGRQSFNWYSSADKKRHRYLPDTSKGLLLDLGVGYSVGKIYIGVGTQILTSAALAPSCAFLNSGITL